MKSYRLLAVTILLSLILHILVIFFVKFVREEPKAEEHPKGEPVEIEVIPKEKPKENPYLTAPETDDAETTLDHDTYGGKSGGESESQDEQGGSPAKSRDDNQEIINRIANAKKTPPKGEDSASYNVFEERYASYFAKFRRRIYQLWEYPAASIARGETGVVKLSFSILKDGSIVNVRMLESSGYPNLDREVMRVIKNMGKVPLPKSYELNQLNIEEAYFIYSIGSGFGRFLE